MKNNKGFTLVELIVVAAMMSILMGAILNFIQPINQFYSNTWATADANDIGNTVVDYLDRELRYTTNMLILEDYEGMPTVEGGYVISDSGAKSSTKFTDVIIIDNVNPRGSSLTDYVADSTVARRKKATGALIRASLSNSDGTIEIENSKIVLGEAEYSDFKAEFTATLAQGTKNKCLQVGIKQSKPKYSHGRWTYDKVAYDQTRSVELVNINQIGFPMQVNYYTNRTDESGNLLGEALDYSRFAQKAAPGGLTTGQQKYYDLNKKYTYIFYTKSVPSSSAKCTIKIMSDTGNQLNSFRVNTGATITDTQYTTARSFFPDKKEKVGDVYTVKTLDKLFCDATSKYLSDYKTEAVTENMEFTPRWLPLTSVNPKGYVKFYDYYDDLGNSSATPILKYTYAYYDPTNPTIPGLPDTVSGVPDGMGDADHMFKGWTNPAKGTFVDGMSFASGDWDFYAQYDERQKFHVKFLDADGNELSDAEYSEGLANSTNIVKPADPTVPSGKMFLGWFLDGDKTKLAFSSTAWTLTSDMTFQAVFENIPSEFTELTLVVNAPAAYNHIVINPTSANGSLWFGMTSADSQWYGDYQYGVASASKTIKIKFKTSDVPTFKMRVLNGWTSLVSSGDGATVDISTSNFVGKTVATITVANDGTVSYS